jgi:serine/threonine protein kinase
MEVPFVSKLGSHEVIAQIGAGGVGEVFQAHDTKLGRDVAIKVLPERREL